MRKKRLSEFHRQTNAISVHVHFHNLDAHLLVEVYHFVRVFDVMVSHLADVDEAVLMHANVDESAEGGDIGHDAVKRHPDTQVVDVADVLVKLKGFEGLSWVAAGLVQLGEDVVDGLQAEVLFYEVIGLDFRNEFLVADEVFDLHVQRLGHLLYDVVTLWVDSALVQWVVAVMDAEEAGEDGSEYVRMMDEVLRKPWSR